MAEKKKIAAKAKIKQLVLKPGNPGKESVIPSFDGLSFPRSQEENLKEWMDGKEELLLTLEPAQKKLPGTE